MNHYSDKHNGCADTPRSVLEISNSEATKMYVNYLKSQDHYGVECTEEECVGFIDVPFSSKNDERKLLSFVLRSEKGEWSPSIIVYIPSPVMNPNSISFVFPESKKFDESNSDIIHVKLKANSCNEEQCLVFIKSSIASNDILADTKDNVRYDVDFKKLIHDKDQFGISWIGDNEISRVIVNGGVVRSLYNDFAELKGLQ